MAAEGKVERKVLAAVTATVVVRTLLRVIERKSDVIGAALCVVVVLIRRGVFV